jgi:phosphoglycolate phosphatase-like HAD superfamily hydrolase
MKRRVIAIDADGVLVNYNASYPPVWQRAFGQILTLQRKAYHAANAYGVQLVKGTPEYERFLATFGDEDWRAMPALDGVWEACHLLHDAGYSLVCVTSIPSRFTGPREDNLRRLDLPFDRVIAVGHSDTHNPKLSVIQELQPEAFVDDLASNFYGVGPDVHKSLIDYGHFDSPNLELDLGAVDSQHGSLREFTDWWLARA